MLRLDWLMPDSSYLLRRFGLADWSATAEPERMERPFFDSSLRLLPMRVNAAAVAVWPVRLRAPLGTRAGRGAAGSFGAD